MELNNKLQQLRKEKGLTQEQLAEKLYVSRTAISKWESGRGYPSIDSLKAISKLFSISIDDLLSGDELITIAKSDNKEKVKGLCDLMLAVSDCMAALLFFLPFFGQQKDGSVHAVSLLSLNPESGYIRIAFIVIIALTIVFGVTELALQNFRHPLWQRNQAMVSVILSVFGLVLFIVSPQPYAAVFVLCLLIIKGVFLIKRQ